jgi:hypothetical protein
MGGLGNPPLARLNPAAQDGDPVGHREDVLQVVADEDHPAALPFSWWISWITLRCSGTPRAAVGASMIRICAFQ